MEYPPYGLDGVIYEADGTFREIENTQAAGDAWGQLNCYRGKRGAKVPGIHMPRWASRITLEVTGVRVERLQAISEEDAKAEGLLRCGDGFRGAPDLPWFASPIASYRSLWESINGSGSWDANPYVWVIAFKRGAP